MGDKRCKLLAARAEYEKARAEHERLERVWLDTHECDGDDYSHPARVALDAASSAMEELGTALAAAENALWESREEREYTLSAVLPAGGRATHTVVATSSEEANKHARRWAWTLVGGRGNGRLRVLVEGEDGTIGGVEEVYR